MQITQVEVMVHEKRNHPNEYGHYDAEVRLIAPVEEQEGADYVATLLRTTARNHVEAECDAWIESIKTAQQHEATRGELNRNLLWFAERASNRERRLKTIKSLIEELPSKEHDHWNAELEKAKGRAERSPDDTQADGYDEPTSF